jgi:Transcription termination factor nusG
MHAQNDTDRKKMIDTQRNWYVVYSKPRKEEQVQLHLGLKGIESFFPRLQLPGSVSKNKGITPLFGYGFMARTARRCRQPSKRWRRIIFGKYGAFSRTDPIT